MEDGGPDRPTLRINLRPTGEEPLLEASAEEHAHQLALRVNALPEPTMRGAVLAEQLQRVPLRRAAALIAAIVHRGRRGGPPFELALGGLEEMLREERLPYETLVELYRELKTSEGQVAALLLPGHVSKDILGAPPPRFPGGRDLTLGERKSLARAAPREAIDRLLRDPEPQVIRLLLRNPRLLERDVVFLAAKRPIGPEVVREILANPRWSARYTIKRALVLNPTVPNEIALRILPMLLQPDLRDVARDPALPDVRQHAARQLLKDR